MSKVTLFHDMSEYLFDTGSTAAGRQVIFRFPNGYGASVIKGQLSYGGSEGLFELAVIHFDEDNFSLIYDTPITDDVIGYLKANKVIAVLREIKDLPQRMKKLENA